MTEMEWDFLLTMMKRMRFQNKWCDIIGDILKNNYFSLLVNGRSIGSVKPARGLCQGCLVSPYLFIICAEGLSSILRQPKVEEKIFTTNVDLCIR